jgi:seryl-tRNA synthetase
LLLACGPSDKFNREKVKNEVDEEFYSAIKNVNYYEQSIIQYQKEVDSKNEAIKYLSHCMSQSDLDNEYVITSLSKSITTLEEQIRNSQEELKKALYKYNHSLFVISNFSGESCLRQQLDSNVVEFVELKD